MHLAFRAALGLLLAAALPAVAAQPPTLDALVRPAQTDIVRISPDGRHLAATSRQEDRMKLVIFDRATLKPIRSFDPEARGAVEVVSWVSDDRLFVMNSRSGGRVEEAFLEPYVAAVNIDGSGKRVFYERVMDVLVDEPDGILLWRCGRRLHDGCASYVQKADNDGRLKGPRLAKAPAPGASFMADNVGRVLVAHARGVDDHQRLWRKSGDSWILVNDEAESGVESWPFGVSRDGSAVFLQTQQVRGPDIIERMDATTGARTVVMKDDRLDPAYIVWSADGREPIGAAYGTGLPRARFWDRDDPDARLMRALERAFPEDAVVFSSGSHDGRHVVVKVWGDRDPGSYYLLDRDTLRTDLVARQRPWLGPEDLAPSEPVAIRARDGLLMDGYLTLPPGTRAPPPLVVMPHGGPFGIADTWGYDEDIQILAAHGYAVLRVNYRGSSGQGRSFIERGYRQWGKAMQDDLADAVRWAMEDGRIDATRMCVYGASYGGYAALMAAVREPDRYRCVVAASAVADLELHLRRGDIRQTRYGRGFLEHAIGSDPQELRRYSPVNHADAFRTPVFLVHGVHDRRVPFAHARAMQKALESARKSPETWFPGDETHGIYGDENRKEFYTRILAFLQRHLAPAAAQEQARSTD